MDRNTRTGRGRKGVTPVVAVVLLVFITVAAAGGSFVFMQEVGKDVRKKFERVEASIDRITCGDDHVNVTMTNTGNREINLETVNMWVSEPGTGRRNISLSRTSFDLSQNLSKGNGITKPDSTGTYFTYTKGKTPLNPGKDYTIEYEFIEHEQPDEPYLQYARCTS